MKTKKKKQLLPLAIISAGVLLASTGTVWFVRRSSDRATTVAPQTQPTSLEGINYGPPTEQDIKEAEENKQNLAEKESQANETAPSGQATPVVTYAQVYGSNIEAAGYVPGVFEDGGTCKYTFTLGSAQVSRETTGFKNVSTTNCTPVEIPRSEFPSAGAWKLVLSYKSQAVSGNSGEQVIQIN